MIKKSTLIPVVAIAIIAAIALFMALPETSSKKPTSHFNPYIVLSGFTEQTNIEITRLDGQKIVVDNTVIKNEEDVTLELNKTPILGFKISENNNIYDINVRINSNQIQVAASGLPLKTNLTLKTDNPLFSKPTPVDWAGRITLNKNLSGTDFCIHIKNKNDLSICHQTEEVTS